MVSISYRYGNERYVSDQEAKKEDEKQTYENVLLLSLNHIIGVLLGGLESRVNLLVFVEVYYVNDQPKFRKHKGRDNEPACKRQFIDSRDLISLGCWQPHQEEIHSDEQGSIKDNEDRNIPPVEVVVVELHQRKGYQHEPEKNYENTSKGQSTFGWKAATTLFFFYDFVAADAFGCAAFYGLWVFYGVEGLIFLFYW